MGEECKYHVGGETSLVLSTGTSLGVEGIFQDSGDIRVWLRWASFEISKVSMNFSSRTRDLGCEKVMYSAMMESRSQPWSLRRQPIMHPVRCCWDLVSYTIKSSLDSWSVPCPCCNVPKRVGYSLWPKFAKSGQRQHPGSSQPGLCLDVLWSDGGLCLLPRERPDDSGNRVLRRGSYNNLMSRRSHIEYTGKEKGHTHTIVFRPSFSIAGRLSSCGNALLYIPFVTSAKLTGSSDAGGSFSKDGPCSWFLSSKSTWVSNKRWKSHQGHAT